MRAPWGAEREGREWRHVPSKGVGKDGAILEGDAGAGAMLARAFKANGTLDVVVSGSPFGAFLTRGFWTWRHLALQ